MDYSRNQPSKGQPSQLDKDKEKKGLGDSRPAQHGHGQEKNPQKQPPKSTQR